MSLHLTARIRARRAAIGLVAACLFGCSAADPPLPEPALGNNLVAAQPPAGALLDAPPPTGRAAETPKNPLDDAARSRCPSGMAFIPGGARERTFCIDRWEASLVETGRHGGVEKPFSPFSPAEGVTVRAVSAPGVVPQGYVSARDAARACAASGKRLCRGSEWRKACRGPESHAWGYGDRREPGRCNDHGRSPVIALFGRRFTPQTMNHPSLNQLENTLAKTGEHQACTNGYGVFDMVGNLHEWIADADGTFVGGYYQDVASLGHGEGCGYQTTAHEARYHDYSTGFRCCADVK